MLPTIGSGFGFSLRLQGGRILGALAISGQLAVNSVVNLHKCFFKLLSKPGENRALRLLEFGGHF